MKEKELKSDVVNIPIGSIRWVGGASVLDLFDIEDAEKVKKAFDEALSNLGKNLRDFIEVRFHQEALTNKVIVSVEMRAYYKPFSIYINKYDDLLNKHLNTSKL